MPKHKLTEGQESTAKRLRRGLRKRVESGGGMIFKAPMGCGKTCMVGKMNSNPPTKEGKCLTLFFACKTPYAENQAEEVGVASGDKPLTLGRMPMLEERLKSRKDTVTFTLTPSSGATLLNPKNKLREELVKIAKKRAVTLIHIEADEVHKWYQGRSIKPGQVAAFREELRKQDITLVVTGITATPVWDVKGKDQDRLAKRACMLFGLEADKPIEILAENTIEVSSEDAEAISAVTRPLQLTPAPETFEEREINILDGGKSQELKGTMADAKQMLLGLALDGQQGRVDRVAGFMKASIV